MKAIAEACQAGPSRRKMYRPHAERHVQQGGREGQVIWFSSAQIRSAGFPFCESLFSITDCVHIAC